MLSVEVCAIVDASMPKFTEPSSVSVIGSIMLSSEKYTSAVNALVAVRVPMFWTRTAISIISPGLPPVGGTTVPTSSGSSSGPIWMTMLLSPIRSDDEH